MKKWILSIIAPFMQAFAKVYFSKARKCSYKDINGIVLPGVFYPQFTISTKLLLTCLEKEDLKNKTFLELGCGTGIISVLAAKKGAEVMASDINPKAIENVSLNAKKNRVGVKAVVSDLFEDIPAQHFDWIVINPPYYPKNPKNSAEEAWYCGENFEYFEKLFSTVGGYFEKESCVIMILSEDCELKIIEEIVKKNKLRFELLHKKKKWGEENYIFQLKCI